MAQRLLSVWQPFFLGTESRNAAIDAAMSLDGSVTASDTTGAVVVTLPNLYEMRFSAQGFRFPLSLRVGGTEVFGPNELDASRCNVEHGAGVSYAPAGVITEFLVPPVDGFGSIPLGIAAGGDGNLWFSEYFTGRFGRVRSRV